MNKYMNQAFTKRSDFKIFVVNIVYRITTDQRCVSLLVRGNTSYQLKFDLKASLITHYLLPNNYNK